MMRERVAAFVILALRAAFSLGMHAVATLIVQWAISSTFGVAAPFLPILLCLLVVPFVTRGSRS